MNSKKYTQFGTVIVIIFLPLLGFFTYKLFTEGLKESSLMILFSLLSVIALISLLYFYQLTIFIDDTYVSFKLGIGLFGRKYRIDNIKSCKAVKNAIFYGIGVKMLPNGWLYNVSGLKAIELSFKDKNSVIRIGTDRPDEISDYITGLISHDSSFVSNDTTAQKPKNKINTFILGGFITLLIPTFLILYGNQEIKIKSDNDGFQIKSMYGITIKYNEISQLDTLSSIPNIEFKNNGYAFGKVCKGNFRLAGIDHAKLFVNRGSAPYLHLKLTDSEELFINFKDNKKTVELYKWLVEKTRK